MKITSGQLNQLGQLAVNGAKQGLAAISKENAQLVIKNGGVFQQMMNEAAQKAVAFIALTSESLPAHVKARQIMGKNFFGVEEVAKHFGVAPSLEQLQALAEVPFSEEVLVACRETHVLVAVFPLSILDIRGKAPAELFYSYKDAWYNSQTFAGEQGMTSWRLVRKTLVLGSTSKNWDEQQELLDKELDEVPTARVMVYAIIGHFLATGERLFEGVYVRTAGLVSGGHHVGVGDFAAEGLRVYSVWDSYCHDNHGLASSRKSQNRASSS